MSNIVPFSYIPENVVSQATPGLWNSPLSALSASIANLNANTGSGVTMSVLSDVSIGGGVFTAGPSNLSGAVTIHANSNATDYLAFKDSSNQRSNYLIGSHAAGTVDGLGIYDTSGNTTIVNFSKQSVRFFVPVIATSLDVGGAAFSVKAFGAVGDGVADDSAAIQAAVNAIPLTGGAVQFTFGTYSVSTTILLPTDRTVTLFGTGGFGSNQGGLNSSGCVIRATSALSGSTLISQVTTNASAKFGVQMRGICLDGNDQTVDLLSLRHVAQVRLIENVFFNSNGNGVIAYGLNNAIIALCAFYELGNQVAHPNGASALVLNSDPVLNTNTVLVDQCHWESGRGQYLTSNDTSGVSPVDLVNITGGKMEQSGNFHGYTVDLPLVTISNGLDWNVMGLMCVNGLRQAATHIKLQNTTGAWLRTYHDVGSTYTDGTSPKFLIDVFSASSVAVGGVFVRGASNNGGQIRIVESSVNGYSIDPTSVFISPLAGGSNVLITNPTPGKQAPLNTYGPVAAFSSGSAALPQFTFGSELSLGLYRSAASAMALSYGQFQLPAGSGTLPSLAFSSESSLGVYRSGTSTMAFSYGSLLIPLTGATDRLGIGQSGGNPGFKVQHNFTSVGTFANAATDFAWMWTNSGTGSGNVLGISAQTITPKTWLVTNQSYGLSIGINGVEKFSVTSGGVSVAATGLYGPAGTALLPSHAISSESSLGIYRSGVSTLALSYGTLNLATQAVRLSMRTLAASSVTASAAKTNVAVDEVVFTIGGASGASLIIYSGGTAYGFNSAFSAAAL